MCDWALPKRQRSHCFARHFASSLLHRLDIIWHLLRENQAWVMLGYFVQLIELRLCLTMCFKGFCKFHLSSPRSLAVPETLSALVGGPLRNDSLVVLPLRFC